MHHQKVPERIIHGQIYSQSGKRAKAQTLLHGNIMQMIPHHQCNQSDHKVLFFLDLQELIQLFVISGTFRWHSAISKLIKPAANTTSLSMAKISNN